MKDVRLWVVFAVGIAAGVLIGRMTSDPPVPLAEETAVPAEESPPQTRADPVRAFGTPAPTAAPPTRTPAPRPADVAPVAAGNGDDSVVNAGITQPIDVGPVFRKQFETARKTGHPDTVGDLHRALERELRDDSWAYPLEAEIENSLVADTSMGNFRREHLECRSSMCEIRLSASGAEQVEALKQWTSDIQRQPWGSRMMLSSSSTVSTDDQMDALLIVTKPPQQPEN